MDKFNVLIIEDESLLAMELASKIESFRYRVVDYTTGTKAAIKILQTQAVDLLLLDINLGEEKNGIEFYQDLGIDTPVVYLTAYKDEDTISQAITTDPLGYLTKPYKEEDLFALLKLAYYKKKSAQESHIDTPIIRLGKHYHFLTQEQKLYHDDRYINLGKKELQLLVLLISAKGDYLTFKTIEDYLYSNQFITNSTIRTLIYRLRKKLKSELIETEFNHGVRLLRS